MGRRNNCPVKKDFPSVKDARVISGLGPLVAAIKKRTEGEGKRILYHLLANQPYLKYAIVVDDDIDLNNSREIEWACTTRVRPEENIAFLYGVDGSPIDPAVKMEGANLTAKVGIDATKPLPLVNRFKKISLPSEIMKKAREIMKKYL